MIDVDVSGGNACDTNPVRPGKLWLFNLEVEKTRNGDGIEKPGSEAANERETIFFSSIHTPRKFRNARNKGLAIT